LWNVMIQKKNKTYNIIIRKIKKKKIKINKTNIITYDSTFDWYELHMLYIYIKKKKMKTYIYIYIYIYILSKIHNIGVSNQSFTIIHTKYELGFSSYRLNNNNKIIK
jgi:hypothetical protein